MSVARRSGSEPTPHSSGRKYIDERESERARIIRDNSDPPFILAGIRNDPDRRVIALDIDQCSALGEDTNDILRIISALTQGFNARGCFTSKQLITITHDLINPSMIDAVYKIRAASLNPYVVFYTSKSAIVNLFGPDNVAPKYMHSLEHGGFFHDRSLDLIRFLSGNIEEGWDYLYRQLLNLNGESGSPWASPNSKICLELRRVGLITWVASLILGLSYAAPVYITRSKKNLEFIRQHLRIPDADQVYLFDDKGAQHAAKLGLTPGQARIIAIPPFSTLQMTHDAASRLHENLTKYFPIHPMFGTRFAALHKDASTEVKDHWPAHNLVLSKGAPIEWLSNVPYALSEGQVQQPWDISSVVGDIETEDIPRLMVPSDYDKRAPSPFNLLGDEIDVLTNTMSQSRMLGRGVRSFS